ncbi:TPA: hypothetical protein R1902_002479, partial [Staphylococcus delphini]|nr:hypothetical protein [Staphylococcus delphini]
NVVLGESDAYENDEFLTFLSSLSISFKTKIINEIYKKTIANLKNVIGQKIKHNEYPLTENSDLLIHLFEKTEFEMMKKVKLSEVK